MDTLSLKAAIEKSIEWLVHSDIRNTDPQREGFGGFNRAYDRRRRTYDLIYCEATGYALSLLVLLNRWFQKKDYLKMAADGAGFLLQHQNDNGEQIRGAFHYGHYPVGGGREAQFYSFDTAICISGLLDLYGQNGEERYLKAALQAGHWLVSQAQKPDGSFRAMYNGRVGQWDQERLKQTWYGDGGCLHAKNAIALFKLQAATGVSAFGNAAEAVCRWVLRLQGKAGFFRAREEESYVFTHAHCYATEGILYAYRATGSKEFLDATLKAGEWLLSRQERDGALRVAYHVPLGRDVTWRPDEEGNIWLRAGKLLRGIISQEKRSDAVAQAIRIWMALYLLTAKTKFMQAADKATAFLLSIQIQDGEDSHSVGGIPFACYNIGPYRRNSRLQTAWSVMFAIHALQALRDLREGRRPSIASDIF